MTEQETLREKYAEINRRNPFVRYNHIEASVTGEGKTCSPAGPLRSSVSTKSA